MELYEKERLLVGHRFPDYRRLREPYSGTDSERLARIADYQAFVAQVGQISLKELDELCIEAIRQRKLEREAAARRSDQLAYFSQPEADADFNFWSKSKTWTVDEATALLLGKDPLKVRWDDLCQLSFESIFVAQYQKLRNQLLRAQHDGRPADGDAPVKFVEWAIEIGFALPADLDAIRSSSIEKPVGDLIGKKRTSALQLIIGMAIKKYKYAPGVRSSIPRQIVDDLNNLGLEITDDTVRTFLNEAQELVDLNRIQNNS
jgi:hypothetical protein